MPRDYAPSEVLRHFLLGMGLGTVAGQWPIWIALSQLTPDNAIIIYDTAGITNGRLMKTGEVIVHPGIQLRIRGQSYPTTWGKAYAIAKKLSEVHRALVAVATDAAYTLVNVSQQGDIQPIGFIQEGDRTTHQFTVNVTVTIQKE